MGKRLHIATKYEVSYQNGHEDFNWMVEEIQDLFSALGMDVIVPNDNCDYGYGDEFEISVEDYDKGIKLLKDYNNNILDDEELTGDIMEALYPFLEKEGYNINDLIKSLDLFKEKADMKSGYLHFAFF